MAIDVDLEQWPFVFSRWDTEQTGDDLDDYLERMTAVLVREQPFVGVAYVKRWTRGSGAIEKMARWMKETDAATRKYCLAAGLITTSTAFRFTLGAVLLIKPMPYPYGVYSNFGDAVRFVRMAARPRGLTLPEPRRPWVEIP
jgi:hypothetical protein